MTSLDMTSVLVHSRAVGTTKLVLLGIAYHMGKDRSKGCWPSKTTLAAYAGVSVRQVSRSLKELLELNELEIDSRASWKRGNGDKTNIYYLTDLCFKTCEPTKHVIGTSVTDHRDMYDH